MSGPGWDFSEYVDPAPGQRDAPPANPPGGYQPTSPQMPPTGPTNYDFGGGVAVASGGSSEIGRPPVVWLAACAVAVVAGGLLAGLRGALPMWAIVAWCLSGPVAIGLLAAFNAVDTQQRARSIYSGQTWVKPVYVVCLVLCGIAVLGSALRIAFWVGRL